MEECQSENTLLSQLFFVNLNLVQDLSSNALGFLFSPQSDPVLVSDGFFYDFVFFRSFFFYACIHMFMRFTNAYKNDEI